MKAVDYLKEKQRMCKTMAHSLYCSDDCPLYAVILPEGIKIANGSYSCDYAITRFPEQAVQIVEKWAKENPVKTHLSVLLERLPNTVLNSDGTPSVFCPDAVFKADKDDYICNRKECFKCWNRECKEEIL